jgi:leucyl aminopeptidase (aminopeptidase T)
MAITKHARAVLLASFTTLTTFGFVVPAFAQQPNFEELAKRIVNTSVNVKPGDVVVVNGGKHNLALMEDLTIEANKAGGMSTMMISTDKVDRSFNVDVPEKYLEQQPKFFAEWIKQVDVWIGLPGEEDNKAVIAGVPEARFAKAAKAGQVITDTLMNGPKLRGVFIGYPTKEEAAANHMEFNTYSNMHWNAVNADYNQISTKGKAIQKALQGAKSVHITSPAGTDVTFSIADRPVYLNDGIMTPEKAKSKTLLGRWVNLPGGSVFGSGIETSANGKVVIPKATCRYDPMNGISFEFKGGKMQNFKAAQNGKCFVESMAPYDGPKDVFSSFSIGLNPALKVVEEGGATYWPGSGAGVVYISIGDNQLLGGANKTQSGWGFAVLNSTVTVDGKVILKDGQIVM